MESQMGKGLKTLFPKIPGEVQKRAAVSLGKVPKRRTAAPQPARGVDAIFAPSPTLSWKAARVSVEKIRIPDFVDLSRSKDSEGLKSSILKVGLLFPILLRKEGEEFELVAGLRRLEAFKELGMKRIAARVSCMDRRQAARLYRESNSIS